MNRNMETRNKRIGEKYDMGSYNTELFIQYLEIKKGLIPIYTPKGDLDKEC